MIYQINNPASNTINYVCPDQATIDEGIAIGYKGEFSIGEQAEADTTLDQNRNAFLQANLSLFAVSKDIDPDPIQTTWIVCDLDTEPNNDDVDYQVFDVVNGFYSMATGLVAAKAELDTKKSNFLSHQGLESYYSFESWPPIPQQQKGEPPISTGLQTL